MVAVWGGWSRINLCFESLILWGGGTVRGGDASTSALQSSFVVLFRTGLKRTKSPTLGAGRNCVFFRELLWGKCLLTTERYADRILSGNNYHSLSILLASTSLFFIRQPSIICDWTVLRFLELHPGHGLMHYIKNKEREKYLNVRAQI